MIHEIITPRKICAIRYTVNFRLVVMRNRNKQKHTMNRHFFLQFRISIEVVLIIIFPIPHDNQLVAYSDIIIASTVVFLTKHE